MSSAREHGPVEDEIPPRADGRIPSPVDDDGDNNNGHYNNDHPIAYPNSSGPSSPSAETPRGTNRVRFDLRPSIIAPPRRWPTTSFNVVDTDDAGYDNGYSYNNNNYDYDENDDNDDLDEGSLAPHRQPLMATNSWHNRGGDLDEDEEEELEGLEEELREGDEVLARALRERVRPRSSLPSAFVNMANSIIGAGIIGQPYALRQAGLLAGTALLVVLTVVVDWTIRLIVVNSKMSGRPSFQATAERCFGRAGRAAILLAQGAFAFGGMVAFGVIIGDSIPRVVAAVWPAARGTWMADRSVVMAIFVMGVSYPLCLYRDISKLARASALALLSMIVILVTVLVQAPLAPAEDRGTMDAGLIFINGGGVFQAIGIISFAFVCHHNSLLIYDSLDTPTVDRFATVTHYSAVVSLLACLAMALVGFLTFGSRTQGNVLNNFAADNVMANVARLCFGLNMLTTLPLEVFVCREVALDYFRPGAPFSLPVHFAVTTGLVVAALAASLTTCDLGAVFELVGATSACVLAYILPPLCYIRLAARSSKTYVAGVVAMFGCLVLVISVTQAVSKMVEGNPDASKCS